MSGGRHTLAEAAKHNVDTFMGDHTHLQLDLDAAYAGARFCMLEVQKQIWRMLLDWGWVMDDGATADGKEGTLITTSKSGNKHKYIRIGPSLRLFMKEHKIDPAPFHVALQVILGSDPVRELYNLVRVMNAMAGMGQEDGPSIAMYETEEEAVKVEKWLGKKPVPNPWLEQVRHERRQRLMRSVVAPAYRKRQIQVVGRLSSNRQNLRCGTFSIKGAVTVKRGGRP